MSENQTTKDAIVEHCIRELRAGLPAVVEINGLGRLLIVAMIDIHRNTLFAVGLEGRGLFFYEAHEEIEEFELVSAGFPLHISEAVAELLAGLLPKRKELPQLESPQGQNTTGASPQHNT